MVEFLIIFSELEVLAEHRLPQVKDHTYDDRTLETYEFALEEH
jgi:hypothetical protein